MWRLRVSHGQQFQKSVHTVTAITARMAAASFAPSVGQQLRTSIRGDAGLCADRHHRNGTAARRLEVRPHQPTRDVRLLRCSGGTMAKRKAAAKRELVNTGKDKRYVRRAETGQFKESDDVGRSLKRDRQQTAKRKVTSGQGDRS